MVCPKFHDDDVFKREDNTDCLYWAEAYIGHSKASQGKRITTQALNIRSENICIRFFFSFFFLKKKKSVIIELQFSQNPGTSLLKNVKISFFWCSFQKANLVFWRRVIIFFFWIRDISVFLGICLLIFWLSIYCTHPSVNRIQKNQEDSHLIQKKKRKWNPHRNASLNAR